MKMNTKILTACVLTLALVTSCKKPQSVNPALESTTETTEQPGRHKIEQKKYDLTSEQTNEVIKKFKGIKGENEKNLQARLIEADSVAVDSSIFVLEAAINFDFDEIMDQSYKSGKLSTEFSIPISSDGRKVNSNDLESLYGSVTDYLMANTTEYIRAQIVDIAAYTTNQGQVTYQVEVATFDLRSSPPCAAISVGSSPYLLAFQGFGCSGNPANDATTLMNQNIKCTFLPAPCTYGIFYTNVVSINTNQSNLFSSWSGLYLSSSNAFLFSSTPLTTSQHCNAAHKTLTASQVNSFLSNGKAQMTSYLPSTPANMIIASGGYTPKSLLMAPLGGSYYKVFWDLNAVYGVKNCRVVTKNIPYNPPG
jgi:hypothetical protein